MNNAKYTIAAGEFSGDTEGTGATYTINYADASGDDRRGILFEARYTPFDKNNAATTMIVLHCTFGDTRSCEVLEAKATPSFVGMSGFTITNTSQYYKL